MEIETPGSLPDPDEKRRWWAGIRFKCPKCKGISKLGTTDKPKIERTVFNGFSQETGLIKCPTERCGTDITLFEMPTPHATDADYNNLTPPE